MVLKVCQKKGRSRSPSATQKRKTSNVLVLTDKNGLPLWFGTILSGNHNDQFDLISQLKTMLQQLSKQNIHIKGVPLNMDKGFDSQTVRTFCFRNKLLPNGIENIRNRKKQSKEKTLFRRTNIQIKVYQRTNFCLDGRLQNVVNKI